MGARRRGPLTHEDKEFIRNNCSVMSDSQIADKLYRSQAPIVEFRKKFIGEDTKTQNEASARLKLRNRPEWKLWQEQFTKSELEYIEYTYSKLMGQFNNDVLPTEEKQIFQIIEVEVLLNSVKSERRRTVVDMETLDKELRDEVLSAKPDKDKVQGLQVQLQAVKAGYHASINNYKVLLEKHASLMADLKGTRAARVKNIENSKRSLIGYIKELEKDEFRQSEGLEAEIMKMAAKKEYDRLTDYHTYEDGTVDRPILTPEILEDEDSEL